MPAADHPARDHALAAAWGFAEATAFFVVPDVWLTRLALRSGRRAAYACAATTLGAVVGGVATCLWARRVPPAASRTALVRLPAVSGRMVDRCVEDLSRHGAPALLLGPPRGVPYKLYARAAGVQGLPLGALVAWSVPARLPRFVLAVLLAAGLRDAGRRAFGGAATARLAPWAHAAFWAANYGWYLSTVGREQQQVARTA